MTPTVTEAAPAADTPQVDRDRVTLLLAAEIFLIFFQGYMVAPLVPRLSVLFDTTIDRASILVPAYMVPYGLVCLVIGPLADRAGRARMMRLLAVIGLALPLLTATASSLSMLLGLRVIAGLALGGIAPIALALIAQLYPYAERGRPVGWFFGAIAGGMAFGATCGPWLEPLISWRGAFVVVAALNVPIAWLLWRTLAHWQEPVSPAAPLTPIELVRAYGKLVSTRRGGGMYAYIFLNGAFHSGLFSWLGVYFMQRYHLEGRELAYAMMGYGIPGIFLGPILGRVADRFGRRWLIRAGLTLAAGCAFSLSTQLPVWGATLTIVALSSGFDLTHPLLAGIVSSLDPVRTAQAMALNTVMVFVGAGVGSLAFGALYAAIGLTSALVAFGVFQLALAAASLVIFEKTLR